MFLTIANVLSAADIKRIHRKADALEWRDGARTAGGRAKAVKRNLQADLRTEAGEMLHTFMFDAITRHPVLMAAARPRRFSRLLLSRTEDGGGYGRHVDNALMGEGAFRQRTDLSFTLFLSDPDTYNGGQLCIEGVGGVHEARAPAGDLVLYPSGAIHEVAPVTKGRRMAIVGWIESLIQDAGARETLFELEALRESLRGSLPADAAEHLALDKVIGNLIRRWSVP